MVSETYQLLWGTYFFLSDEYIEHQQTVRTIFDILSSVGGIMSLLLASFGQVFLYLNRKWIVAKLVRSLYFTYKGSQKESEFSFKNISYIKFKWHHKMVFIKKFMFKCLLQMCCHKRAVFSFSDVVFAEGERHIKRDLNVFHMVQNIQKLKVAVAILMQ